MKTLIIRVHGMAVSLKFGIDTFDRDDPYINQKRTESGMTRGKLIDELAPCRTDALTEEMSTQGMYLTNVVQIMCPKKHEPQKKTPVLYLTYSDEGALFTPKFNCSDDERPEVEAKFSSWIGMFLFRSWDSGQIYQNENSISIAVVGALKLSMGHQPLYIADLLDEAEPNTASAS